MSEPKRYHLWAGLDVHAFAKCEAVLKYCVEDEGAWVMYEDYASLKAEVERLAKLCQATSPDGFIHIRDINAAKEGKQP